ncbi:MAG: hypothetical protein SFX72_13630 [Isosphaeraceae bacterium]|nr:hypothetical protein [Isosphaeraceae bacterium]
MSGPIVRKYGFPNFEQIFGKRELEHGVDAPATPDPNAGAVSEANPQTPSDKAATPPDEAAPKS